MNPRHTRLGVDLLRNLVDAGLGIFSVTEARAAAAELGIRESYVLELLHHLKRTEWIRPIKRGVYAITEGSGFENPPHDFEIAMALVSPSAISHWTALYHHHLTQQIPQVIFALTPTGTYIPRPALQGTRYRFIQIQSRHYFGIQEEWMGASKVSITDPERTLLDGLLSPQHCGGIHEVLGAFKMRQLSLDLTRIVDYACRLDGAVAARLGWILERQGCPPETLESLQAARSHGVRNLDASGPSRGPIDRSWQIRENLGVLDR